MDLELPRDEGVRRADQMQDLDDLLVAGHGAARRETDRCAIATIMRANKARERDDGVRHRADALRPRAPIVETRPRAPVDASALAQGRQILGALSACIARRSDAGSAIGSVEAAAEPGLEQAFGFGLGVGVDGGDPRRELRDGAALATRLSTSSPERGLIWIVASLRHVGAPAARGVGDQERAARRQAREEGHDRDDDHQRAPRDRIAPESAARCS